LFTMSKMTRSCHKVVMRANVHPFWLHNIAINGIANIAHILNTFQIDSALTME
jgi:hypothetical protein